MALDLKANLSDVLEKRLTSLFDKYSQEKDVNTTLQQKIDEASKHKGRGIAISSIGLSASAGVFGALAFHNGLFEAQKNFMDVMTPGLVAGYVGIAYAGIAALAEKVYEIKSKFITPEKEIKAEINADKNLKNSMSKINSDFQAGISSDDFEKIKMILDKEEQQSAIKNVVKKSSIKPK